MKIFKRIASGTSAAVLTLSTILTMGFTGVAHAASTCTWIGTASGDKKFSTAANWSGCNTSSDGIPHAGDTILFNTTSGASGVVNLTNDLGVTLGGLTTLANASGTNYGWWNIDTLALSDGAVAQVQLPTSCSNYSVNVGVTNLSSPGSIDVDGVNLTTVNITNNLTLHGAGYLQAGSGSTVGGSVIIANESQTDGCPGGIGAGSSGPSISGFTIHSMTVENGGSVFLNDVNFPLTLGGGSGTAAPIVDFPAVYNDTFTATTPTTYTVSGPITLNGDAQFDVEQQVTVNITGSITGSGYKITRTSNSEGVLNNNASSDNSATGAGPQQNTANTVTASDSQPNTDVTVPYLETFVLDGARRYVDVHNGAILKGDGTANDIYVSNGGTIAPGHSPGILTSLHSLTLAPGSTYQAQLKDTAAGDFDQIIAGDPSQTTGHAVTLGDGTAADGYPTLDVQLYSGYNMKAGDTFEIINNKSGTSVDGQFNNLPEGATFSGPNGSVFKITYKGGDGNDVVLTVMTAPKAPDTGFALMAAHPGATLGVTILAAGTIFMIARTNRKPAPARARASRSKRR